MCLLNRHKANNYAACRRLLSSKVEDEAAREATRKQIAASSPVLELDALLSKEAGPKSYRQREVLVDLNEEEEEEEPCDVICEIPAACDSCCPTQLVFAPEFTTIPPFIERRCPECDACCLSRPCNSCCPACPP